MISAGNHEKVFLWLSRLAKEAPFDIKTTAASPYRRVVIQQKMREAKDPHCRSAMRTRIEKGKMDAIGGLGPGAERCQRWKRVHVYLPYR